MDTSAQPPAPVLAGVDRAALVAALGHRLRAAGVPVTLRSMSAFAEALDAAPPAQVHALYWLARLTLVNRQHDLAMFDAVFEAVFGDAVLPVDPHARRTATEADSTEDVLAPMGATPSGGDLTGGLPWHTLPRTSPADDDDGRRAGAARAAAERGGADRRHPVRRRSTRRSWRCSAGGWRSPRRAGRPGAAGASGSGRRVTGSRCARRSPPPGVPAGSRWSFSATTPCAAR